LILHHRASLSLYLQVRPDPVSIPRPPLRLVLFLHRRAFLSRLRLFLGREFRLRKAARLACLFWLRGRFLFLFLRWRGLRQLVFAVVKALVEVIGFERLVAGVLGFALGFGFGEAGGSWGLLVLGRRLYV
jgi:hypothetical protein